MKKKTKVPNIVRGGTAVPLGNNYYYMTGRKHETGGIDIGKNPRTGLEVEDGEVMHIGKNEIKVFSAQPFLNGKSPAQRVIQGDNPNAVFNAQESFKKRNKINDDGTKKKRMGGKSRNNNDNLRSELRTTRKYRAGGLYSVTSNGVTKLHPFPSTGKYKKAPYGTNFTIKEPKDVLGIYRPFNIDGSINPFYNSTLDRERHLKEFRRATNINDDGTFNLKSYLDKQKENNDPFKLKSIDITKGFNSNNNSDNNPEDVKLPKYTKKDYWLNGLGLTSNIVGSIIANKATNKAIDEMIAPIAPTAPINKRATKLKTRININPQLTKMAESIAAYEKEVDNNTTSSQVALSRKQQARTNAILMANELYADKENKETSLINQDRLNQQTVTNSNVDAYNEYLDKVNTYKNAKVAFENDRITKKADNTIGLLNNINLAVQDVIDRSFKRRNENQTIAAMALANPNLPIELLYAQGLVNKRTYDIYKKAYRNKKD